MENCNDGALVLS